MVGSNASLTTRSSAERAKRWHVQCSLLVQKTLVTLVTCSSAERCALELTRYT